MLCWCRLQEIVCRKNPPPQVPFSLFLSLSLSLSVFLACTCVYLCSKGYWLWCIVFLQSVRASCTSDVRLEFDGISFCTSACWRPIFGSVAMLQLNIPYAAGDILSRATVACVVVGRDKNTGLDPVGINESRFYLELNHGTTVPGMFRH
jgi:hypothetical protein